MAKEKRDYTGLVPMTPPVGLQGWMIRRSEELQKNVLVYSADGGEGEAGSKRRTVRAWCSACGTEIEALYVQGGGCARYGGPAYGIEIEGQMLTERDTAWCPECGASIEVRHARTLRTGYIGEAWAMSLGVDDGVPYFVDWITYRKICLRLQDRQEGRWEVETITRPYEAYVIDGKGLVRLVGYDKYMSAVNFRDRWAQRVRGEDKSGKTRAFYPFDPAVLHGTALENAKLDLYLAQTEGRPRYPISYALNYVNRPQVENLIMQGAGRLYNELLEQTINQIGYYGQSSAASWKRLKGINWKEKRPSAMLGLDKPTFRRAVAEDWTTQILALMVEERAKGRHYSPEDVRQIRELGWDGIKAVRDEKDGMKRVRYVCRQRERYGKTDGRKALLSDLKDYWRMAKNVGEDLRNPETRWPQHLLAAHDAMILRQKYEEDQKIKAAFANHAEALQVFAWASGGLLIRPVRDQAELVLEGKLLHHCVGNYAKSFAEGRTAIFFIRHEAEPDKPYFTLELDEQRLAVRQNRGSRNCDRTEEVAAFEAAWLEHIKTIKRQEAKTA